MLDSLIALNRRLSRWSLWFAAIGLVAMTLVIGWLIFGRYVLNDTPAWAEQFSLLLMIYYILFAAAAGVRENFHLGLVFVKARMPDGLRRYVEVFGNLLVGGFGLFMAAYGWVWVETNWTYPIPTVGLPEGARFIPFPIAGGLIILFCLEHVLRLLAGRAECDAVEETAP